MVTLRQLYQQFGHDPKWTRFATASTTPMATVYLRKLGDRDITSLSDFDLALQFAMSDQPEDRKVKARACMRHMLNWAAEHGHTDIPSVDSEPPRGDTPKPPATPCEEKKKPKSVAISKPKPKKKPKIVTPKPKALITINADPDVEPRMTKTGKEVAQLDHPGKTGAKCKGTVYHDTGSKGWKSGKRVFKDVWRAEITIDGQRFRHRGGDRLDCERWLQAIKRGDIHPTDNKADWWRMEQHKDEEARIDELIVSAAEEANIVYEYRQTGDTEILYNYCIKALLPHMVYYCAHSLHLGRDRSLTCSRQAVGLILTKIVGGRPVTNITFTCKRMLRTYKNRGDFWYYDKAPEAVKLMVNRIDMSALAELYKVTKDRRI